MLKKLALAVVAALLPLLAAEMILRTLALPADTPGLFPKTASDSEWSGRPSTEGMYAGVPVSFNRFGLRDRERTIERTPGTIRVVTLGDSMTFGMGVPEPETFPRMAETLLNAGSPPGSPLVEVLNFSLPGYNTLHQLAQLKELGLSFDPDLVMVGFFYNDVEPSTAQLLRRERAARTAGAAPLAPSMLQRVRAELGAYVDALAPQSVLYSWAGARLGAVIRQVGLKSFGQTGKIEDRFADDDPEWQRARAALLEMKRLCAERRIPLVIVVIPAMARFTESGYPMKGYHTAVARFCRAHSITCLDLLPAFWGLDGTRFWISLTDGHPDARGHRIMAEAVAPFLAPLLRERPPHGRVSSSARRDGSPAREAVNGEALAAGQR
jgi:lysophospholipase L1-like esterase